MHNIRASAPQSVCYVSWGRSSVLYIASFILRNIVQHQISVLPLSFLTNLIGIFKLLVNLRDCWVFGMACIILDIHALAEAGVDSIRDDLYNTCMSNVFRRTCISGGWKWSLHAGPYFSVLTLGCKRLLRCRSEVYTTWGRNTSLVIIEISFLKTA